jgi:D-glycero-alpha-D-manno-heptose-7-phosphate kinase
MIVTRTALQFRLSGGTALSVCVREHGGAVLATTIEKCCYITCRRLAASFE